jgi:hypothetical protein
MTSKIDLTSALPVRLTTDQIRDLISVALSRGIVGDDLAYCIGHRDHADDDSHHNGWTTQQWVNYFWDRLYSPTRQATIQGCRYYNGAVKHGQAVIVTACQPGTILYDRASKVQGVVGATSLDGIVTVIWDDGVVTQDTTDKGHIVASIISGGWLLIGDRATILADQPPDTTF